MDTATDLQITYRPTGTLKTNPRNARTHSPAQCRQIADSIRAFGFTNPILIDDDDRVLAGHGRLAAAVTVGLDRVPTIRLSQMSDADKRAYVIADNRLAEKAGWDRELLALEFRELAELDLEFDLTITGFEMVEIDGLLQDDVDSSAADTEPFPEGPAVSRPGDLFVLGPHRVVCGDARDPDAYRQLLNGEVADVVFTDPPYNVPIAGHVSGTDRHREFPMACGEMSPPEFTAFLATVFENLVKHTRDGAIHYVCMDWRHLREVLDAGHGTYSELKNVCVWTKTNAGQGSFYRSQHELVLVFKAGEAPHLNNVELGKHGRYRTNVWSYAAPRNADHPTVKPVPLVADALLDCAPRRGVVLDPFGGSGTTLFAAQETGRRARLLELDPAYVDLIVRRWEQFAGNEARHPATGSTFATLAASRTTAGEVARG